MFNNKQKNEKTKMKSQLRISIATYLKSSQLPSLGYERPTRILLPMYKTNSSIELANHGAAVFIPQNIITSPIDTAVNECKFLYSFF